MTIVITNFEKGDDFSHGCENEY